MIAYKHGRWGIAFAWTFKGSVLPLSMTWAIPAGLISGAMTEFKLQFLYPNNYMTPEGSDGTQSLIFAAVGSFLSIMGFMVVFRSNQAWSRFWEGITLVQTTRGQWFNATSNLFAFCTRKPDMQDKVRDFQELMVRLVSLLFATAISSVSKNCTFDHLDLTGIDEETLLDLKRFSKETKIELILQWIQRSIVDNQATGILPIAPPILSRVFQELGSGVVNIAAARKINDIPFPFPYAQVLSLMMLTYTIGSVLASAWLFQTSPGAFGGSFLNVLVLWSVNYLAVEIESPLGMKRNDAPVLNEVTRMNQLLIMLLQDEANKTPTFSVDAGIKIHAHMRETLRASVVEEKEQKKSLFGKLRGATTVFTPSIPSFRSSESDDNDDIMEIKQSGGSQRSMIEKNAKSEYVDADERRFHEEDLQRGFFRQPAQEAPPPPAASPPPLLAKATKKSDKRNGSGTNLNGTSSNPTSPISGTPCFAP